MKKAVLKAIQYYQSLISPDTGVLARSGIARGNVCVFYPSCSQYMADAVLKYGVLRGLALGVARILRCHPWQKKHIDPLV